MAANDVCLLVVESENQAISLSSAQGFSEITSYSPQSAGTASTDPASRLALFWKRTAGGDTAPTVADSGDHTTGQIYCFSGVVTSGNPWDIGAGGNDSAANDTTGNIPGATTTVNNDMVVLITSTSYNPATTSTTECSGWTNANLINLTEQADNADTAGLGGGHCLATGEKSVAGSYATTAVTLAHTSYKGAISLELKPEPGLVIYRSVGTNTAALASGSGNNLTISGSTATFASALPSNVGVGDAIQYDSDNNGSIDAICFISGCSSSTSYTVKNAAGGTPTATSAADQDWSIFRAYTKLDNAVGQTNGGTENSNINATVKNFDTWSGGRDIAANNEVWNIACYGDGADTTQTTLNGWTTAGSNYLRIYTPYLSNEVGVSQRHTGKYTTSGAYRLEVGSTGSADGVIYVSGAGVSHIRFEGLQIYRNAVASGHTQDAILMENGSSVASDHRYSYNIIRGISESSDVFHVGIDYGSSGAADSVAYIFNNVFYDFRDSVSFTGEAVDFNSSNFSVYVYNNTMQNLDYCLYQRNGTFVAKNNICQDSGSSFSGTFDGASTKNNWDDGTAPGTSPSTGEVTFLDEANDNFHLSTTDSVASGSGADLSADSILAITDDIDNEGRPLGNGWDIGADETLGRRRVRMVD